ncbi:hypothetical protein GJV85_09770 [Sulfurimonas aquatica]|uniref:Transposase IS200-like domain-containing protein n=1 Tax=Sulfurimonas aquatica TaxID=2672570 RepID=A0A975GD71_9BACT|nr:transposase [Sulfurimonas aquatica]QSZ42380.1 hypothetical protein GJV85_09770 [Sulfurimonas aquatica]
MYEKLPHISLHDYYQFITFRTYDSMDAFIYKIQDNHNLTSKMKQFHIDAYLDESKNGAYLFGGNIAILKDHILSKNNILYEVDTLCIMPNHVHLLIKQKDDLSRIMKYIKAKSAIELNKSLGKKGKFWLSGYFDRLIRNQEHYDLVYRYILDNPFKVNLLDAKERVYSKYEL